MDLSHKNTENKKQLIKLALGCFIFVSLTTSLSAQVPQTDPSISKFKCGTIDPGIEEERNEIARVHQECLDGCEPDSEKGFTCDCASCEELHKLLIQVEELASCDDSTKITKQKLYQDLIKYRDEDIFQTYDKTIKSYDITAEHLRFIQNLKSEIESLKTSNDWGAVATIINLQAELFENLLTGSLSNAIKNGLKRSSKTVRDIYHGVQQGKRHMDVMTQESIEYELATELGNFIPIVSAAKNVIQNINNLSDYQKAKFTIIENLNSVENEILRSRKVLRSQKLKTEALNNYLTYLDEYLSDNFEY